MPDSSSSNSTGVTQSQTDGSVPATDSAKQVVVGNGKDAPEPARDKEIKNPPKCRTPDPSGDEITTIFCSTRQFVIYEAAGQVRFMLPDDYGVARVLRSKIADLGGLRTRIEGLRADKAISANESMRAARELAWALALAFEDERSPPAETAKQILTRVDARLCSLAKSACRRGYVFSNLAAFAAIEVLLVAAALISWGWSASPNVVALHRYAMYGAFGGLGALLSVVIGIRSIDFDVNLKFWEHAFSGATRILIGVVGAVVVGLALDSHFVDPTLGGATAVRTDSIKHVPGMLDRWLALRCLIAFVAGFSESLVPNLLRRGEQLAASAGQASPTAPIKDVKV